MPSELSVRVVIMCVSCLQNLTCVSYRHVVCFSACCTGAVRGDAGHLQEDAVPAEAAGAGERGGAAPHLRAAGHPAGGPRGGE